MQAEFVSSLHNNYERVRLDSRPDEKKYQYCILSRGGIHGLLPCDLRYINGDAYLYFDITSRQNLAQLFYKHKIKREWVKDFVWSLREIRQELDRFLLSDCNILWSPENIYQDLEKNTFFFVYIPYLEEDNGFNRLLDFIVEGIDYEDEALVNFVYKMYEQLEENGEIYLQGQVFEDVKMLDNEASEEKTAVYEPTDYNNEEHLRIPDEEEAYTAATREKKNIFSIFEGKRNKDRAKRNKYRQALQLEMEGRLVAEDTLYNSEYGKTVFMPDSGQKQDDIRKLYSQDGKILVQLGEEDLTIGKIPDEAGLILEDLSVSRIHARILREDRDYYLEDLNATNGTFKNGLRLKPYEKRKLQAEDEITLGNVTIFFR
ncbi:MAG: FHA domain-containing protein [Lachnospiraceae bacterium]|nr:FHA domain-containing protein [Lachnospiraceae bacterium]